MTTTKKSGLTDVENARIKYQTVISLKNSEGEIQWNRYNAMLVVNTILIGLVGLTYSKDFTFPQSLKILFMFTPVFGLVICKSWYEMTYRGFLWSKFWMMKANEIEEEISGKRNPIKEGGKLKIIVGEDVTRKASFRIIYIFVLIYGLMLLAMLI